MAQNLRVFIIDAFTAKAFGGNAAAVVLVPHTTQLSDDTMQKIASEMNQPMTAFIQPKTVDLGTDYTLTWFNPREKATFCGHATLASAHALFNILNVTADELLLDSPAGLLGVRRAAANDGKLTLRFPSNPPTKVSPTNAHTAIFQAFVQDSLPSTAVTSFYYSESVNDLVVLIEGINEEALRSFQFQVTPELVAANQELGIRAAVFVVPGDGERDSFTRVFHIGAHIDEDQVTGSAHTIVSPLLYSLFGKSTLRARQCSKRGGELLVELQGNEVMITGEAVTIIEGELTI